VKVHLDRDKCDGLGVCESVAPAVFEINGNGVLEILQEEPDEALRGDVETACASCPTAALSISG
jgi:ferredoxin